MKIHLAIGLLCVFPAAAMAQRGGGHASAGGFRGGSSGISSFRGGFAGGGYRTGGFGYGGYRGSYGYRGFSFGLGYYPWYGYGLWPGYWGGYYSYPYDYYDSYGPYAYSGAPVSGYGAQPQVTVVYPPASQPAYNLYVPPSQGGYDQYGQPIAAAPAPAPEPAPAAAPMPVPGRSPIYLIAFRDHTICAAESYSVSGDTLHYVTLEHQEKLAPLASVDRALSAQLNRERHVSFALPNQ
jgi:hypothetical protein